MSAVPPPKAADFQKRKIYFEYPAPYGSPSPERLTASAAKKILCSWIADRYQADPGQIYLAYGNISHGARFPQSHLVLVSETEVFRQQKKQVGKKFFQEDGQKISQLDDLKVGDYVVHMNHGIGRYMGIERLKVSNS